MQAVFRTLVSQLLHSWRLETLLMSLPWSTAMPQRWMVENIRSISGRSPVRRLRLRFTGGAGMARCPVINNQ
jgi:hypothetical protein